MTITTLDGVLAGMQAPVSFNKSSVTPLAAATRRAYTWWYSSGCPGASVAPSPGINGATCVYGNADVLGALTRSNPTGGQSAYLAQLLALPTGQASTVLLLDRIWHNSGLSVTSTTAQAITPVAIPARDQNGTTNGLGVIAGVEWSSAGGAGTPTVTLTYTNQAGTTGQTATFTGVASPPAGTIEFFALAAGDTGVRACTSFIQSATRTSGTMHLCLYRVVAMVGSAVAGNAGVTDFFTSGRPQIYDNSCLQLAYINSSTTANGLFGTYVETQG